MKPILTAAALAVSMAHATGAARAGCGPDPVPCAADGGIYHIELPADPAEGQPALMFLHGFGSSGEGTLRNRGMVDAALERGYAVIAPSGTEMEGRGGRRWSFHPARPAVRDEIAFLTAVRDDAARRHGIDAKRTLLGGFSIGGSMASYLACARPDTFAAYAPVAGGFWRPHPDGCAGPVRLLHTHGWSDGTVPLEGRVLRGTDLDDPAAVAQGDIFTTLEIWRDVNDCAGLRADAFEIEDLYWRRDWTTCSAGTALSFALHPGGHGVPPFWITLALDWFEGL